MSRGCGLGEDDLDLAGDDHHQQPAEDSGQSPQQQQEHGPCASTSCSGSSCTTRRPAAGARAAAAAAAAAVAAAPGAVGRVCLKCKSRPADTVVKQNEAYCAGCLAQGMLHKVRGVVRARQLMSAGDTLLVAVSGGPASLALLHLLLQLRNTQPGRLERGCLDVQLLPTHVLPPMGPAEAAARTEQISAAVAAVGFCGPLLVVHLRQLYQQPLQLRPVQCTPPLHPRAPAPHRAPTADGSCALPAPHQPAQAGTASQPLEGPLRDAPAAGTTAAACSSSSSSSSSSEAEAALQLLLDSVQDPTGREDLSDHLRRQLLLLAAAAAGCSKVVLGSTATALARRVISDAAKGRGFSLATDIQLADAAQGWSALLAAASGGAVDDLGPGAAAAAPVAVLQPLQEVTSQEALELCRLNGWPLLGAQAPATAPSGAAAAKGGGRGALTINQLTDSFVSAMAAKLPASVYTVLRTASHLEPPPNPCSHATTAACHQQHAAMAAPEASSAGAPGSSQRDSPAEAQSGMPPPLPLWPPPQQHPQQQQQHQQQRPAARYCRVCLAPLPQQHKVTSSDGAGAAAPALPAAALPSKASGPMAADVLCYSCQRQVLGSFQIPTHAPQRAGTQLQQLLSLLPPLGPTQSQ